MEKLYHYTIADRLRSIYQDNFLKLCPKVPMPNETQYVWMTSLDVWDKTAFYGYPDSVLDNATRVRITINPTGLKINRADDISSSIYNYLQLVHTARLVQVDSSNWYVSPNRVPRSSFIAIDIWKLGKWINVFKRQDDNSIN